MAKQASRPPKKSSKAQQAPKKASKTQQTPKKAEKPQQVSLFRTVLIVFAASFVLRGILNLILREAPTIVIDESLYTNIARSLAAGHGLAYRDQPVNYPYLLYPLMLVPVYWLQGLLGGDLFRWVQLFNTAVITSSVIPAYLFARDFTRNEKTALWTAVIVALMPDLMMGGYEMTECVIWPLSLWLMFFACRLFTGEKPRKYGLLTALISALMFYAKPGAIVMGAVVLVIYAVVTLRKKKGVFQALLPAGTLLLLVVLLYGVYFLLVQTPSTLLGLYDKQTSEWQPSDLLVMAEGSVLTCFLFIFACGGIFALVPLAFFKDYQEDQRKFVLAVMAGLLAAIVGTAIFVVPYKWYGGLGHLPLHMRYCAMYIPAFFVFSMALERPRNKVGKTLVILLAVFAVLSIFPGARAGFVRGETTSIDSAVLSAFAATRRLDGDKTGTLLTIATVIFALILMGSLSQGWKEKIKRASASFFAAFLLFNCICAYVNANIYVDPTVTADAREVNRIVGHKTALGLTQRYYDDVYTYWMESRINAPMQQVTNDQIYVIMNKTQGIYSPFVPIDQAPNLNNHETPDTDLFVLGMTIAQHLELSDTVEAKTTTHGHFTVAQITPGQRWVDTMMYGMNRNVLAEETDGAIRIFDERRNVDGHLVLHITASGNGTLNVGGEQLTLSSAPVTYDVTLPFANRVDIRASGSVEILSYTTDRR